jgi:probable HAF family extracellular repeat protein
VTGYADTASSGDYQTFLYDGANFVLLGTLGGGASQGFDVNASGQVTGGSYTTGGQFHAFLWDGVTMVDLGTMGGTYSFGRAINDAGQIAGYLIDSSNNFRGFLYTPGVGMADVGSLGGPFTFARGINSAGWVTGNSTNASFQNRAFVYDGATMRDLNLLSFVTPLPTVLTVSHGINDVGQIIANGEDGRAFLLTPVSGGEVPEPGTWALIVIGLAGIGWRYRVR